jgi:hypothetical protein
MRKLAVGIVVALVGAGAASAGSGQPRHAFTAAGQALARSIVLRRGDLPASFRSTPSSGNTGKPPSCKGFKPDESDLTLSGRSSAEFDVAGNPPLVSSDADVWSSVAQARSAFDRVVRPGLSECLFKLFAAGLTAHAAKGVKYVPVSHSLKLLSGLGEQAGHVRLVFTGISGAIRIPVVSDYYAVRKGRVTALITTLDLRGPYALGPALAAKVVSRMPS